MNTIRQIILIMAIQNFGFVSVAQTASKTTKGKPNILILLADDLGYGDVGFHRSDIQTPNIDKLADEGIKLEQFYSCSMCSPTRAGLMTGRYPIRFGLMRSVIPPYREFGLSTDEETVADMLGKAGYNYRGIVGKWHLGHRLQQWLPTNRGFTYFEGCHNGAIDYFDRSRDGALDWHINDQPSQKGGYTTDIIGEAAVEFIESVPKEEPFFLYVPFTAPHSPFQAKQEDMEKYPKREGVKRTYAGMVDCLDQNIGKILNTIKERGQLDNTFILFFSDNGGVLRVSSNGEQRGEKLTPYQGGIRVVAAARWPAGGISGGKVSEERMGYIDVFPTLMAVAGYNENHKNNLDGINILGAIKGERLSDRAWFTYEDQGDEKIEKIAINTDRWKLVVHRSAPDSDKNSWINELFQIADDPKEETDLAAQNKSELEELLKELNSFYDLKSEHQIPRYSVKDNYTEPVLIPNWQPTK
ncbi:MAG: arylsulfatase [Bacteroidales bacterium]|nr:arylsulfatase [Bacteroidales bacterium]MBN2818345.1 arylsulfatase [Bacteroidales bacterium]